MAAVKQARVTHPQNRRRLCRKEQLPLSNITNYKYFYTMKKIFFMLLGVAATMNVMAVDYTAKAKVTLTSEAGYSCNLMLSEAAEYGALNGSVMNFEDRKVALYVVNGAEKLQIAKAADLSDVKLGFMGDASTSYTLTVSSVEGTETLYIQDGANKSYALTNGASYTFTAAANATDEARFVLKKSAVEPSICFNYNVLEVNGHAGESLVIKQGETEIENVAALGASYSKDLSAYKGRLVVTLNGKDYQIDANPAVTVVP
jgi:hypothetical protein